MDECIYCEGRGYVMDYDHRPAHTRDCSHCQKGKATTALIQRRLNGQGMADPDLVPEWPWPYLQTIQQEQGVPKYLDYLDTLAVGGKGVMLMGPSFAGKTTLARWTCQRLEQQGHQIAGIIWTDWVAQITSRNRNNPGQDAHIKNLASIPVLLIDDVLCGGIQGITPAVEEGFFQGLIDRRREYPDCITIMTSNQTTEALEALPERILNRLNQVATMMSIQGDWRR